MRLAGAVTEASGAINEDGYGMLGTEDDISAAWIFDGVTGINGKAYLPGGSDAAWLVARAHHHLTSLASGDDPPEQILTRLVENLIGDWSEAITGIDLPPHYDPPAACLVLVKRYAEGWKSLRLGDSCLLAREADRSHRVSRPRPTMPSITGCRARRGGGATRAFSISRRCWRSSARSFRRAAPGATAPTATASSNAAGIRCCFRKSPI